MNYHVQARRRATEFHSITLVWATHPSIVVMDTLQLRSTERLDDTLEDRLS